MQSLKQKKVDSYILEVEPFVYNFSVAILTASNLLGANIRVLSFLFGFGTLYLITLFVRSIINNFCRWHQILIANIFLVNLFWILEYVANRWFDHSFISDENYIILFAMFCSWITLFIISSLIYLRKRIKKTHKRCFQR